MIGNRPGKHKQYSRRLSGPSRTRNGCYAARNASLESRFCSMIADAQLLYIEKSLFLTVPLKHMETALHSLAVLHEVLRRIGMPLSDASVKVNFLECRYTEIH